MAKTLDNQNDVMAGALAHDLDELAVACRILEMEGHGSRMLGHMALRDPEGRGLWLKRAGIGFGEVFDKRDFILIDFAGKQLFGDGKRHSEWPIHAEIMKRRADINASVHSHPLYGRVFSATDAPLRPVANSGNYFEAPPPRFEDTSELIRDPKVAARMAERLGGAFAIFLRNHGVVFCAETMERVVFLGIRLEEACREQLMIAASGLAWSWPEGEEFARKYRSAGRPRAVRENFEFLRRRLAALEALGHPSFPGRRLAPGEAPREEGDK